MPSFQVITLFARNFSCFSSAFEYLFVDFEVGKEFRCVTFNIVRQLMNDIININSFAAAKKSDIDTMNDTFCYLIVIVYVKHPLI